MSVEVYTANGRYTLRNNGSDERTACRCGWIRASDRCCTAAAPRRRIERWRRAEWTATERDSRQAGYPSRLPTPQLHRQVLVARRRPLRRAVAAVLWALWMIGLPLAAWPAGTALGREIAQRIAGSVRP